MAFKTFVSGAVLTAADLNTYLMPQTIVVCTSATRPSAPSEGNFIFETDTDLVYFYTGAAWQLSSAGELPYAAVSRAAVQVISNNTWTTVSWDTEGSDARGLHSGGAFTVPAGMAGVWTVNPVVFFEANATGRRSVAYSIDGGSEVEIAGGVPYSAAISTVAGNADVNLTASQALRVRVFQDSGVSLNVTGTVTMVFRGPV